MQPLYSHSALRLALKAPYSDFLVLVMPRLPISLLSSSGDTLEESTTAPPQSFPGSRFHGAPVFGGFRFSPSRFPTLGPTQGSWPVHVSCVETCIHFDFHRHCTPRHVRVRAHGNVFKTTVNTRNRAPFKAPPQLFSRALLVTMGDYGWSMDFGTLGHLFLGFSRFSKAK